VRRESETRERARAHTFIYKLSRKVRGRRLQYNYTISPRLANFARLTQASANAYAPPLTHTHTHRERVCVCVCVCVTRTLMAYLCRVRRMDTYGGTRTGTHEAPGLCTCAKGGENVCRRAAKSVRKMARARA
jgi:hypothetical protein